MSSGIKALVMLSQVQSDQADTEAYDASQKVRDIIDKQKTIRDRKRAFEDMIRDKAVTGDESERLRGMLGEAGLDQSTVHDGSWDGLLGNQENGQWTARFGDVKDETQAHNGEVVEGLKRRFEDGLSDLDNENKLSNFEVQDLMARYNQAESIASSLRKKLDDTENGQIQKI